jgi:hypothetical protein
VDDRADWAGWAYTVHMKLALSWCVFGYPNNTYTLPAEKACATICAGPLDTLKDSLTGGLLDFNATQQYDYCYVGDSYLNECAACLHTVEDSKVLGNCKLWEPCG